MPTTFDERPMTGDKTPLATEYRHSYTPPNETELIGTSNERLSTSHVPISPIPSSTPTSFIDENEKQKFWSKATLLKVIWFLADIVYSFSLLLATAVRGSALSSLYLLAWILGVVNTFKSRMLTVFTLFVALSGVAANTYSIVWYENKLKNFTLQSGQNITDIAPMPGKQIFSIFGIDYMEEWDDYLFGMGPDVLMLLSSTIHLFILHRQLTKPIESSIPTTMPTSRIALPPNATVVKSYFSKDSLIIILRGSEVIVLICLFLCAFSAPGYLCGVYYLVFLYCLLVWTFWSPKITRNQLENENFTFCYFFGPTSTLLMMFYTIPVLFFCHGYQYPIFHNSSFGRYVGTYANIFVLPGTWDNWPGYVFYGAQLFLLATSSRTYPIYKQIASLSDTEPEQQQLTTSLEHIQLNSPSGSVYHDAQSPSLRQRRNTRQANLSSKTSFYSAHESVSQVESEHGRISVKNLLERENIFVRIFLEDRGVLGAIAAAIFWSVSYPSYLLSILFGMALLTLGSYGLVIPRMLLLVLNSYAVIVSFVTYTFVVPVLTEWPWLQSQIQALGVGKSRYPLIDLAIHNGCLFLMCFCLRIRLRYRDLLQELREEKELERLNAQVRISALSDMSDTSSHLQHENLQTHRMTWIELLKLWFRDMQCVFISLLDTTVLFTIFVTVLSTSVNLLQTGYLLLAACLCVFQRLRRRMWRYLLIYTLIVCFLMYIWNVICPTNLDKTTMDTIGLTCFAGPNPSSTWNVLWPTLFIAQLILIIQVVIQLVIYMKSDSGRAERQVMMAQAPTRPVYFLSRLTLEIDLIFRIIGGIIAYLGFLFLGFIYEVDKDGRVTVIGWIQVVLMFTLLGSHMSSMVKSPRGNSTKTQFLWRIVLFYEGIVLILRYVYQFKAVEEYIREKWHLNDFLTLEDIGLERYSATTKLSGLFGYLFPTALLAGITAWNLRSMKRKLPNYEILAPGRSRFLDGLIVVVNEFKRMVFIHSPIVLLVFNMAIVCRNINAFNVTYLSLLIATLFKPKWTGSWKSLFWLSSFFILCLYAFQVRSLQPEKLELLMGLKFAQSFEDSASWFGLARVNKTMALIQNNLNSTLESETANSGNYYHPSIWSMTWEHLVVMILCLTTRASHFWDPEKDLNPRTKRQRSNGSEIWNQSNDIPFLKSLQNFFIRFTSEGSVTLTMLTLLVSAFIHRNIISIMYLLVVRWIMVTNPITVCRNWTYLAIMLLFVCISQYFIMLWFPPFLHWQRNTLPPWTWFSPMYQEYFALNYQHPWGLFCDYCCLLFVYMIPGAKRYYLEIERRSILADAEKDSNIVVTSPLATSLHPGDANDFTTDTNENQRPWQLLVFFCMNYWVFLLLILVFISGCVRYGLASGIYLSFAIYMLFYVQYIDAPGSKMLLRLREFSWIYMFLLLLFQVPFLTDKTDECELGTNSLKYGICLSLPSFLDFNKFSKNYPGAPIVENELPILSIIIFWMINIQELIYQSPYYDYIRAYTAREEDLSHIRRKKLHEKVLMDRLERWSSLKQSKQAAILRLKSIISKMVNKVEEMMDIASGLNYSLPPTAPQPPTILNEEISQNSITITWIAPESSLHRIRSYTITRQVYPPTTLLGDYTDPIEVKASAGNRLVVDGLRPGTSYQFKVAASSRMGEGPFSAPSVPVQTFSLNWGGTCLAGWVHYKKTRWPQTWWSKIWSQKVLPRYAVVDNHAFVWYKNESVALKHRSMKKRKRMKTSFFTRDVSVCELSEELYQANEMSDEIYAIYVVATARNAHQVRYTLQLETKQEFDRWVVDLARLVPRHAIGSRLEGYLATTGNTLPSIEDSNVFEDEEKSDGQRSEWSSVTGDESWLNDAEDEELSESKNLFALGYLAFYTMFYNFQDVSLQHENQIYDEEDEMLPSWFELYTVIFNTIRSHSGSLCCLIFIFSFIFQGDLLNVVYVFVAFGFLLVENPRPHSHAWHFILRYSFWVVCARYLFQLPVFCQNITKTSMLYPSIQPYCPEALVFLRNRNSIQPMVYFGLYKFDGIANPNVDTMWKGVSWNFIVILSILFHRRELQLRGMWHHVDATDIHETEFGAGQRGTLLSRDSLDVDEFELADFLARHKQENATNAKPQDFVVQEVLPQGERRVTKVVAFENIADDVSSHHADIHSNENEINSIPDYISSVHDDIPHDNSDTRTRREDGSQIVSPREALVRAQYARLQQQDSTFDNDNQVNSPNISIPSRHDDENEVKPATSSIMSPREYFLRTQTLRSDISPRSQPNQLERDESSEELETSVTEVQIETIEQTPPIPSQKNRFLEWFQRSFPSFVSFLNRLWPNTPENWDKDIQKAIKSSKPGRDYLAIMLAIPFLAILYAFLFFKYFGEPLQSSESYSINLSDSMLNGYMVLIVFFELIIMMMDRAAYICNSLHLKIILHLIVLFGIHIGFWIIIPIYMDNYFQSRIGLQFFYFLHCIYLWISCNQIKHGYLVFRSNHFSKKPIEQQTVADILYGKAFRIYMLVPFAFEIRCLLDWMCSKTALNREMWLLLEETAATLFIVRQEMNERIDDAIYLKGNKRHPMIKKFFTGGIILIVLLLCVLAPLAMFSSLNPTTIENPIKSSIITFGLIQEDGTIQQFYTNGDTNSKRYTVSGIKSTDLVIQKNSYSSYSKDVWISSPPLRRNLIARINSTEILKWNLKFTFTRDGPEGNQIVSKTFEKELSQMDRLLLMNMVLNKGSIADPVRIMSSNGTNLGISKLNQTSISVTSDTIIMPSILISKFYDPVLKVGASTDPVVRQNFAKRDITIQRHAEDGVSWWVVTSPDARVVGENRNEIELKCNDITEKDGICLISISDNIVSGLTKLGIGTYGLTAAYIFVIFTVGAFFKELLRGEMFKVLYMELPNPNDLLDLVEGIYIARKEEYIGHLKDEGRLYETLIRMLRSPETLMKLTGSNAIHIPPPKEKYD